MKQIHLFHELDSWREYMDIPALTAFLAVADNGSFSVAAERLFLTQPAVSKRVAALESELGVPLLDRIARRVTLTEAGRALLPHARRVLQATADGRRALDNLRGQVAGRLTVGTSHHIGLHRLPPVLRAYHTAHPQVQLDIRFMDSEEACRLVESGELELGIVTLPLHTPPALEVRTVWPDPLAVVTGPGHPLAGRKRLAPTDLSAHPAILPAHGTYTRETVEAAFQPLGLALQITLSTNYLETIKMLVEVGLGWSVLPQTMVDAQLVAHEVTGLRLQRRLGIVTHRARTLSNAARALQALLLPS